jgi:hypothetical protein
MFLNNNHDGAFGVRFTTNSDIISVTPVVNEKNVVSSDFGTDIAVIAGNGSFEQNQPVAVVTMKDNGVLNFSDVRFNEANVGGHTVNLVENNDVAVAVYPNPVATSMALTVSAPESGSLTIRIYDAFGKLVNTIHNGNVSTGTVNATWNTMDMNGTLVAAGSYIVRVEGAGVSTSKVVSVVR